jgi:HSP20 family molecular chaperone IbpA
MIEDQTIGLVDTGRNSATVAFGGFMSNLSRFEQMVPFRDDFLFPIEQEFNKFFNEMFGKGNLANSVKGASGYPKLDVYTEDDKFMVKAAVAGVKPEDVKVEITPEGLLTISNEQVYEKKVDTKYFVTELRKSCFRREVLLPEYITGDPTAEISNGMLTLSWDLPKEVPQKPKTKTIEVKVK